MNVEEALGALAGAWMGTNKLRMMPDDAYDESESTATVRPAAGGLFVTITYTWVHEGEPQDGLLLVGDGEEAGSAVGVWVDSWHQSPQWMELRGNVNDAGSLTVEGAYPYGPDAAAGWRIRLESGDGGDELRLAMDNVVPEKVEPGFPEGGYQVVEASYSRRL